MPKAKWGFGRKGKADLNGEVRGENGKVSGEVSVSIEGLRADQIETAIREKLNDLDLEIDLEQVERVIRQKLDDLDWDKLEKFARERLAELDPDKVAELFRNQIGQLDVDLDKVRRKAESKLGRMERKRLVDEARRRLRQIDGDQIENMVQTSVDALVLERLKDLDADKLEAMVRERLDVIVEKGEEIKAYGQRVSQEARQAVAYTPSRYAVTPEAPAPETYPSISLPDQSNEANETNGRGGNPISGLIGLTTRLAVLAAVGWVAYSYFMVDHHLSLPKAIPADQMTVAYKPTGPISVYRDTQGTGRPLVLIHSINAAASAYEMRPLFQHYRGRRPIYAIDLPGFGFSARAHVDYSPNTFIDAIIALLEQLDQGAVDVVALSLSSEFAAEVARRRPELVHSLTLISPTGFSAKGGSAIQAGGARNMDSWLYPLLRFPLWARPLFDLITTHRNIEQTLQKTFVGQVTPGLAEYDYVTAHQPGAEHAPLAFISGRLFTPTAFDTIYRQVQTPTLVLFDRDPFSRFERLPDLLATNRAWRATRIVPTLGLPHFERLTETAQALDQFWDSLTSDTNATHA